MREKDMDQVAIKGFIDAVLESAGVTPEVKNRQTWPNGHRIPCDLELSFSVSGMWYRCLLSRPSGTAADRCAHHRDARQLRRPACSCT